MAQVGPGRKQLRLESALRTMERQALKVLVMLHSKNEVRAFVAAHDPIATITIAATDGLHELRRLRQQSRKESGQP